VGPGLFLALALLVGAARAERSVGLDAVGVDPLAAVDNSQGLDVRDALGRPVSGQAVLTELKKAAVARAAQVAAISNLPKARVILPMLELASEAHTWLTRLADVAAPAALSTALPSAKPKIAFALVLVALAVVLSATAPRAPRSLQICLLPCQRAPEVLRC
jgi:hypothetical protein